jgi:hypothetical protein
VKVDDFGIESVLFFQNIRGLRRSVQSGADGKDGNVGSTANNICVADGEFVAFGRNAVITELFADIINALALKNTTGPAVQRAVTSLCFVGVRGRKDFLRAGDVRTPRTQSCVCCRRTLNRRKRAITPAFLYTALMASI